MKLIFSRKGFDSSSGKKPSPILEAGELCSLPVPESAPESVSPGALTRYEDIRFGDHSPGAIVRDLTDGAIQPCAPAHLDPDLNGESITRRDGWRPLFGQSGAAESHLQHQGVQAGDLFLFYGWFRCVSYAGGVYRYIQGEPDLHVIFGWLQIERRIELARGECAPDWAVYHPHCRRTRHDRYDSLYLATPRLQLPGMSLSVPGGGIFPRYRRELCLTNCDPYTSRRYWRLPACIHPGEHRRPLTYHAASDYWMLHDGWIQLKSAARGQEFVLDCEEYPEVFDWLAALFTW